jgi:hypothetical protein
MSAIDLPRAAIVANLESIADIGRVHDHEPYAADLQTLQAFYLATIAGVPQLRGWYVRRTATKETSRALGRYEELVSWKIQGFLALNEAARSEFAFDTLLEAIRDAFRSDETLSGTVVTTVTDEGAGVQVAMSGPVMFAGVLCHGATLTLATKRYF